MKKALCISLSIVMLLSFTFLTNALNINNSIQKDDKSLAFTSSEFKILVLSDTQDDHHPSKDMLNLVSKSIEETSPDLIVFTGDLVEDNRVGDSATDDDPFHEGVVDKNSTENTLNNIEVAADAVLNIFQQSGIPFAIAQGNNDHKCGITNEDWIKIYSKYSNCLVFDESNDEEGRLDYHLPVKNSKGETVFNLWMIDTGKYGITDSQLDWYRNTSSALAEENGKIIPAIAFQHIQMSDIGNLFEKCNMWDPGAKAIGTNFYRLNHEIANGYNFFAYEPGHTSDEFKAFKEQGDVIGAFFGHQHVEGFSGKVDGIELGFTYGAEMAKTGPYGYRLITLNENDITNYKNELYTYEGSVKTNNAHFELQIDEDYPVYSNVIEKIFYGTINSVISCVSVIISLFT